MLEDEPVIPMVIQYSSPPCLLEHLGNLLNAESSDAIADTEQVIMIRFGQVD